ncbi:MAG: hypothetical protein ACYSWW_27875 [Planctomycetota bacterium]|jgi:hypothetical protein
MRKFLPLLELAACCFFAAETDGVLLPFLAALDLELAAPSRPRAAVTDFAAVGTDGLSILIELPMRDFEPVAAEPDGLSILIELPMRDLEFRVLLLPLEPMPDLVEMDTDGELPLIELPMRDLEPVADCLLGTDTDGDLLPIELPIREVLPELMRLLELAAGCLLEADAEELRVLIELPMRDLFELMLVDLRAAEELDGREMVTRLDVDLLGLRLEVIEPDRPVVILLEPVDPPKLRLDVMVRDRLADGLLELLRLDVTRLGLLLDVVVRERLGVGALLADILLELLRLEVLDLVGVRTDRELTLLLRLLPELAEALDLGAGADLETCDLLLLDPPLLLLFAAKTGPAASAKIRMQNARIEQVVPPCRDSTILILDL